jgi:hypothetical protein
MIDHILRLPRSRSLPRIAAALLLGVAVMLASAAAHADHRGHFRGHRGGGSAGPFHHGFHHFHSFVFFGAGAAFYPGYYPYYPAYYPPPTYISPTDCYNIVPRAPGVADLYTCAGQYVGPVAVP